MWSSRLTFILAAVGSAVGLGNAWRFPGLAAKHGGGTFLVVYLLAMLLMGIPLLMMEISIARKFRRGAIEVCYYSVVFAWVILMFVNSWQFAGMTADNEAASTLFLNLTQTTAAIDGGNIPGIVLVCLLIAWGLIFYCIRNGAKSVGKVVKFTVFAPVVLLLIMAVKGCTMEGAMDGIKMLFVPDVNAFSDPTLWVDAIGQVFYSLSIMMAIMFAYGSYVGDDADIAADAMIIAFSDMAVSVLSGIVMFSTMGGTGMLGDITASGIGTAFFVYPTAIVNLTNIGWLNAAFGAIFYLMLITLAIDSAFSIVEGISAAISDKFHLKPKTVTIAVCAISGLISLVFITQAGLAWLDIVDNWTNQQPHSHRYSRVHRDRLDIQPPQGAHRSQPQRKTLQDAVRVVRGFDQVHLSAAARGSVRLEHDHPLLNRGRLRRISHLGADRRRLGCIGARIHQRIHRQGRYRKDEKERLHRGRNRLERLVQKRLTARSAFDFSLINQKTSAR